ncbi:MAG: DUF2061 domain-containing protein [Bacteroidetes bacterium]|nr:DUF2061 domain-containing protein [Bacteroidota bacterium]
MANSIKADKQKDSPTRSILKAFSWRFIASGATFIITFVIFRQYTTKSYTEILETASIVTIFDIVAKLILYYLHERLWTNVSWGKYWKRQAWKRRYRKLHKNIANGE